MECCFADCPYNPTFSYCNTHACKESILSPECKIVEDVCTGKQGEREFINSWTISDDRGIPPCVYYLSRKLLVDTPPIAYNLLLSPPPVGLFRSSATINSTRLFMDNVIEAFTAFGYRIGSPPNSITFSPVEYSLYRVCRNTPGICSFLSDLCSNYTLDTLLRIPSLANWCGCYLPDKEYSKYVDLYQVTKQCTPYCSREDSVPLSSSSGTEKSPCKQSVCILDEVAIELANSTITDGLKFTQICGSCGEYGTCSCITTKTSLTAINSTIGGIDFRQTCGSDSKCTKRIGPYTVEVDCAEEITPDKKYEEEINGALNARTAKIIFFILGAILIVGIVWFFLR